MGGAQSDFDGFGCSDKPGTFLGWSLRKLSLLVCKLLEQLLVFLKTLRRRGACRKLKPRIFICTQ
jgi:hypothetical protein